MFLDGNELTQSCSLVCLVFLLSFFFSVANFLASMYRTWLQKKKRINAYLTGQGILSRSSPVLIHSSRLTHWTKLSVGLFFF